MLGGCRLMGWPPILNTDVSWMIGAVVCTPSMPLRPGWKQDILCYIVYTVFPLQPLTPFLASSILFTAIYIVLPMSKTMKRANIAAELTIDTKRQKPVVDQNGTIEVVIDDIHGPLY